jgi:subtilisin family serine protease
VTWYDDLQPKIRDEVDYIVREFAEHDIVIGGVPEGDAVAFMYAEGQLLIREPYLEHVREVLGERGQAEVIKRVIRDIVLLKVTFSAEQGGTSTEGDNSASEGTGEIAERPQPPLLRLLDDIDAALGPGIATPDHVATVAGNPCPCPATEPEEVYNPAPYPPVCPGDGGAGVRIYVADTGVLTSTVASTSWLAGVTGDPDPRIAPDGRIRPYAAHGTFVAGVVRCMAPAAEIVVENVFKIAGSGLESDFVPKLYAGFGYGAEIFHLTVATQTRRSLPLIAFQAWLEDLHQHKGVVCVVAAGNNDSRTRSWPAAFPGVISVGALGTDQHSRAYFSNYGSWVDVYSPGQNLVNAFATGPYRCHVAPNVGVIRHFSGMAQWSGTSFSTPIVTGLIAARMTRRGESAQEAAAALLAKAWTQRIRGVGPVLLPSCEDDDPRCGHRGHDCDCGHDCGCGHDRGWGHGHGKHGFKLTWG